MKTRIIQDEPEPTRRGPPSQRSNIAARMARWSAHNRKKAIFGWLALSIALFAVSIVSPMKQIVFETSGPGESGRMDKILYEDFRQPEGEAVLIQHRTLTAADPAFQKTVRAVIAGVAPLDAIAKVESPLDEENSGQISGDKHSAYVRTRDRWGSGQGCRHHRSGRRPSRRATERAPRLLHRLVRNEYRKSSQCGLLRRPEEGGRVLGPADPDHPRRRLRRARRGRNPAPPRSDRGPRDPRPRRAHQPGAADVRCQCRRSSF